MRLIKSILQPANMRLSRQLGGGLAINTSKQCLNQVLIKTHNLDRGSRVQWRGKSFDASVLSDTLQGRKPGRKVPKHERRAMVENYVKKYRAMKAGKFPSITETKSDVGGSFYTIRQILQELEYNSKMLSMEMIDENLVETKFIEEAKISTASEDKLRNQASDDLGVQDNLQLKSKVLLRKELEEKSLIEAKVVLNTQIVVNAPVSTVDTLDSSSKGLEPKEHLQSLTSLEETLKDEVQLSVASSVKSNDVGKQSRRITDELEENMSSNAETNTEQETTSKDKVKVDELQPRAEIQQPTDSEQSASESHKVPKPEDSFPTTSSVWQNLKSFASGFFYIWRK